ncbi:MAG: J domain-containing protein [Bacteroidota bacterium]
MGRLEQSYRTLGLQPGASLEEIKRARRRLALKWHPDRHASNDKKLAEAEERIKEINAAFSYLKRIKGLSKQRNNASSSHRSKSSASQNRTHRQRRSTDRSSTGHYTSSYSQSRARQQSHTDSRKQKTKSHNQQTRTRSNAREYQQTWFDRFATRITNWRLRRMMRGGDPEKVRQTHEKIHKHSKRWREQKEKFDKQTRVGVYRSLFNALLFGKFSQYLTDEHEQTTSLGGYNSDDKYDVILRHSIIRDHIFYAFNRGVNLFFKYSLCVILVVQIIYFIYTNFRWGYFWGDVWTFVGSELLVLTQLGILFLPDNLYQRYLLWNYRDLSIKKVRKLFRKNRLPQPHEYYKNWMLVGKYTLISGIVWLFY